MDSASELSSDSRLDIFEFGRFRSNYGEIGGERDFAAAFLGQMLRDGERRVNERLDFVERVERQLHHMG